MYKIISISLITLIFSFSLFASQNQFNRKELILNEIRGIEEQINNINTHEQMKTYINIVKNNLNNDIQQCADDALTAFNEQLLDNGYEQYLEKNSALKEIRDLNNEYEEEFDIEETKSILTDMYLKILLYGKQLVLKDANWNEVL